MGGIAGLVYVRGVKACTCIRDSLPGIEADLRAAGLIQGNLSGLVSQGAFNTGVSASAGTHDGGGCWDLRNTLAWGYKYTSAMTAHERNRHTEFLAIWRRRGVAIWQRTPKQSASFPFHYHAVWVGCPHLSSGAAFQVSEYRAGRNGLAGRGADDGPRVGCVTWQQGLSAGSPAARVPVSVEIGEEDMAAGVFLVKNPDGSSGVCGFFGNVIGPCVTDIEVNVLSRIGANGGRPPAELLRVEVDSFTDWYRRAAAGEQHVSVEVSDAVVRRIAEATADVIASRQ